MCVVPGDTESVLIEPPVWQHGLTLCANLECGVSVCAAR